MQYFPSKTKRNRHALGDVSKARPLNSPGASAASREAEQNLPAEIVRKYVLLIVAVTVVVVACAAVVLSSNTLRSHTDSLRALTGLQSGRGASRAKRALTKAARSVFGAPQNKSGTPKVHQIQLPWFCYKPGNGTSGIQRSCMRPKESISDVLLTTYIRHAPIIRSAHATSEAKPRAL